MKEKAKITTLSHFKKFENTKSYRAFRGFGQAKVAYGPSQFSLLSQLPLKITLILKVVKIDSKIIISLC